MFVELSQLLSSGRPPVSARRPSRSGQLNLLPSAGREMSRAFVEVSRAASLPPPAAVALSAGDSLKLQRRRPSVSYISSAQRLVAQLLYY